MGQLSQFLKEDGLIRDLRNGEWMQAMTTGSLHPIARELLEFAKKEGRMVWAPPQLKDSPDTSEQWYYEAEASSKAKPLTGIVVGRQTMEGREETVGLTLIEKLNVAKWWLERCNSVRVARSAAAYQKVLEPIIKHSRSLMFIDPYIDPSVPRYQAFVDLVTKAFRPKGRPPVRIEIHRAATTGSGRNKEVLTRRAVEEMFLPLVQALRKAGMRAELFIWDDFHDRHLISNLIGLTLSNGFDIEEKKGSKITFAQISGAVRDDVIREFDANSGEHHLLFEGPIMLG